MTAKTTKPMLDEVVNELRVVDHKPVDAVRLDPGPEFSGSELVNDLRAKGVHVERTVNDDHETNARIEREGRTVQDGGRAQLAHSVRGAELGPSPLEKPITVLWPLAQNCEVFLLNHAEHPSRHPSQVRFGDAALVLPHKFSFFERVTYVRHASELSNEKRQRFEPRGEAGLFGAYMHTSPLSFFIVNEAAFFDGRWRTCITRAVTPVFGTDGRPVYPLRDVAPGPVARRIIALLDALPKGRRDAAHLSALQGADHPADFGELLACIQGAQVTDEATEELTENQGAQATVEQAYELACVTRVLSQRGGDWTLPEAEAARRKEATKIVDKYNALAFTQANVQDGERIVGVYDWGQFSVEYPNATITNGFMLTHEKFVEVRQAAALRNEQRVRVFKGRFVANGKNQVTKDGVHSPGVTAAMFSQPMSEVDMRCLCTAGMTYAYEHGGELFELTEDEYLFGVQLGLFDGECRSVDPFLCVQGDEENAMRSKRRRERLPRR